MNCSKKQQYPVSTDHPLSVYLRIKPIDLDAINDCINREFFSLKGNELSVAVNNYNKYKETIHTNFNFVTIFKPSTTQQELFESIIIPRVQKFLRGQDSLVFAYGTSSSGKTFSIQGTPQQPGLIPLVMHSIFTSIENAHDDSFVLRPSGNGVQLIPNSRSILMNQKNNILSKLDSKLKFGSDLDQSYRNIDCDEWSSLMELKKIHNFECDKYVFSVWVSYYEVYNECIYDLLDSSLPSKGLQLGAENGNFHVKDLSTICVSTWKEAVDIYKYGKSNLHVSATGVNKKSSRSHYVFDIKLIRRSNYGNDTFHALSNFVICDLAGSERVERTGNVGERLKEAKNINTSLLTLGRCFDAIRHNQIKPSKPIVIPYRESKLTQIFKKYLINSESLCMITHMSQAKELVSETIQVLKLSAVAYDTKVTMPTIEQEIIAVRPKLMRYSVLRASNMQITTLNRPNQIVELTSNNLISQMKNEILRLTNELESERVIWEEKENDYLRKINIFENSLNTASYFSEKYGRKYEELVSKQKEERREAMDELLNKHQELHLYKISVTEIFNDLKSVFNIHPEIEEDDEIADQIKKKFYEITAAADEELEEYQEYVSVLESQVSSLEINNQLRRCMRMQVDSTLLEYVTPEIKLRKELGMIWEKNRKEIEELRTQAEITKDSQTTTMDQIKESLGLTLDTDDSDVISLVKQKLSDMSNKENNSDSRSRYNFSYLLRDLPQRTAFYRSYFRQSSAELGADWSRNAIKNSRRSSSESDVSKSDKKTKLPR